MEVGHDLQDGQEKESPLAVRDAGLVVAQAKVDETNENTEDNGLAGARLEGERVADGDNPGTLGELQQLGEGSGSLDRLDLLFLSHQAGGRVILLEERKGGEGQKRKQTVGGKLTMVDVLVNAATILSALSTSSGVVVWRSSM